MIIKGMGSLEDEEGSGHKLIDLYEMWVVEWSHQEVINDIRGKGVPSM